MPLATLEAREIFYFGVVLMFEFGVVMLYPTFAIWNSILILHLKMLTLM